MRLPERLAAFRANFEAGGPAYHSPAWVHEPMHRATDELIASGAAERALKAGDRVPEFALKDAKGREIASWELRAKGPLVVTFYPDVWCPYCNMDLQALQEALPAITEQGAQLIAISPQSQHNSLKSERENKVTFPILPDPGNEVAARFGLRFKLPDYLIESSENRSPGAVRRFLLCLPLAPSAVRICAKGRGLGHPLGVGLVSAETLYCGGRNSALVPVAHSHREGKTARSDVGDTYEDVQMVDSDRPRCGH